MFDELAQTYFESEENYGEYATSRARRSKNALLRVRIANAER